VNVAHHPQSHGVIERVNRVITSALRALTLDTRGDETWVDLLPPAIHAINVNVNRTTGFSPFRLTHGFEPRLPLTNAAGIEEQETLPPDEFVTRLTSRHLEMLDKAARAEEREFAISKAQYERAMKSRTPAYEVGQYVMLKNFAPKSRLAAPWGPPHLVVDIPSEDHLQIQDLTDGSVMTVHVNNVAPFRLGAEQEEPDPSLLLPDEEYQVQEVLDSWEGGDGRWWFTVTWKFHPLSAPAAVCLADCHLDPVVKAFVQKNRLRFAPRHRLPLK